MLSIHLPKDTRTPIKDLDLLLHKLYTPRDITFFDELIHGYIVVGSAPSQFDLFLDISIFPGDIIDNDPNYASSAFLASSTPISDLVLEESIDGVNYQLYQFDLPIKYPKKKLNAPKIVFCAKTKVHRDVSNPQLSNRLPDLVVPYLDSLFLELNVGKLSLSSEILETEKPSPVITTSTEPQYSSSEQIIIPVISPLVIKLKSTKPAGINTELIASFSIEASDQLIKLLPELSIEIAEFELNFSGHINNVNEGVYTFPLVFGVDESISLNFKLINNDSDDGVRQISASLVLKVLGPGQTPLSSTISTSWQPYVDFSMVAPPISNSLKTVLNQPQSAPALSKRRLVNSGTFNTLSFKKTNSSPTLYKKSSSSSSVTVNLGNTSNSTNLFGLKLTFNGKLTIGLGEISVWKVQAINTSSNKLSLSLLVQGHKESQVLQVSKPQALLDLIPAYTKASLFSLYRSLKLDTHGVVILDNDIRIGPIEPNCVFETEIKLMGLSRGVFNLDGLNIYDHATGDSLDFGKLVEVFVT